MKKKVDKMKQEPFPHRLSLNSQYIPSKRYTPEKNKANYSPQLKKREIISSQSNQHRPKIKEVPNFDQMKKAINKRNINYEKLKKIQEQLELRKQIRKLCQERAFSKQQYFEYQGDPMLVNKNPQEKEKDLIKKERKAKKQKKLPNLIQVIQVIRKKSNFQQVKSRIDSLDLSFQNFLKINQRREAKQSHYKKKKQVEVQKQQALYLLLKLFQKQEIKLQKIITMEDQNYFNLKRNNQQFNIFKLCTEPDNPIFFTGYQQLKTYRFSNDSIIQHNNKHFNQQLYKNLSSYSRLAAIKNASKYVPMSFRVQAEDLAYKMEMIGSKELLQLANGQLLPEQIKDNFERKLSSQQLEQFNHIIPYKRSQNNKRNHIQIQNDQAEYLYYKERRQSDLLKRRNQQKRGSFLEQSLREEQECRRNNIKDVKLMEKISMGKEQLIRDGLQSLSSNHLQSIKYSDLVNNVKKRKKDGSQNLKVKAFREDLMKAKKFELNKLPKRKSKSKRAVASKSKSPSISKHSYF